MSGSAIVSDVDEEATMTNVGETDGEAMIAFDGFIVGDGDEVATVMAVSGIDAFIGGDVDGEAMAMMAVVGEMEGDATMHSLMDLL